MPLASFTKVREVSSEDPVHLAENLIKNQAGKKWKTKTAGEKSAYVILEMSECQQIVGIDIGNEHSAFVEVLVGKSSCSSSEDFTEILITCSFMTPPESRSSNNINRVRCFNMEALVPSAVNQKWSLVKVVCSQPFNRHVSYGLSFIKVHVISNPKTKIVDKNKSLVPDHFLNKERERESYTQVNNGKLSPFMTGRIKFREDSPDSESESSFSLFNRWKKFKDNKEQTNDSTKMVLEIPESKLQSSLNDVKKLNLQSANTKPESPKRNHEMPVFEDGIKKGNHGNHAKLTGLPKQIKNGSFKDMKSLKISTERKSTFELSKKQQSSSYEKSNKKITTDTNKFRPFNQLLNGVVLVISGIQNPDRSDLRNKALALGAKYKGDWDDTCTHLICAFKNTPKYNQVKCKGKIVTRSWIENCYSLKKYLPWRRYALDSDEMVKPESDEEILNSTLQDQAYENKNDTTSSLKYATEQSEDQNKILALYDKDDESKINRIYSESDTDDEIIRVEQKKNIVELKARSEIQGIYEALTDEEDYLQKKRKKDMCTL